MEILLRLGTVRSRSIAEYLGEKLWIFAAMEKDRNWSVILKYILRNWSWCEQQ